LVSRSTTTALTGITTKEYFDTIIPLTSIKEQEKIASVLSKVDDLIDSFDKIIESTTRLKSGLMQQLLTKGIENKQFIQTKIGAIPKPWTYDSIKNFCNEITLGVVNPATPYYTEQSKGIPYFRSQNVRENNLTFLNMVYIKPEFNKMHPKSVLKENDILTVQTGVKTGMTCLVPKEYEGSNCHSLLITRPDQKKLLPQYLSQFLNSSFGKKILSSLSMQSNRDHLLLADWRLLKIPLPPISEQQKIISVLLNTDDKISEVKSKKFYLDKLKKGLMQNLLTGKIRVMA